MFIWTYMVWFQIGKNTNFKGKALGSAEAARKQARVIVVQKDVEIPKESDVTVIKVEDTRYAMAFIRLFHWNHRAFQRSCISR